MVICHKIKIIFFFYQDDFLIPGKRPREASCFVIIRDKRKYLIMEPERFVNRHLFLAATVNRIERFKNELFKNKIFCLSEVEIRTFLNKNLLINNRVSIFFNKNLFLLSLEVK